jgi:short-subunit dehydrogenase
VSRSAGRAQRRRALVTGASAGIGLAFAERLAHDGWDLRLVARRRDRLEALARNLKLQHRVAVEILAADLTKLDDLASVERRIARDRRVELVVNNAGMGDFGSFVERDRDVETSEIQLNTLAVMRLTHSALPGFLRRGRGSVINVSSTAGFQPCPHLAVYAATKAFLNSFTESLAVELAGTGVRVQALCPGLTRTEIFERAGADASGLPSFLWMDPHDVVDESLDALARGSVICVPGFANRAISSLSRVLPHEASSRIAGMVTRQVKEPPKTQASRAKRRRGARPGPSAKR